VQLHSFFILTRPSGAARYLHDWYNGIHAAASSLAKLVNSSYVVLAISFPGGCCMIGPMPRMVRYGTDGIC
jgi:hypothetical protein